MGVLRAPWIWAKSTCEARGQFKLSYLVVREVAYARRHRLRRRG